MTTLIILNIISIFVLILILLITNAIGVGLKIHKITEKNPTQDSVETPEFKAGMNHAFYLVQMCLYKMYHEEELLDFESINNDIKNNLLNITEDKQKFNTWFNKYNEFLKSKGTNPPDADF